VSVNIIEPIELFTRPILDVRSPSEFAQGHIPGAFNLPLFDDEERAQVGTLYKKSGKDAAVLRGLELVGPKLSSFIRQARSFTGTHEFHIYCWRGGMRSESLAWLLNTAGFKISKLRGGYKSYRSFIRQAWSQDYQVIALGGRTGSGKTKLLNELTQRGHQVLDLEGIAHHKGSAFGHLNEEIMQPTNEQFENDLFDAFKEFDLSRPILVENESRTVGKVGIPTPLFQKIQAAPILAIKVSQEERISNILRDYGDAPKDALIEACHKISKKLGGDRLKASIQHIENGEIAEAVKIILDYYDQFYDYGLRKKNQQTMVIQKFSGNIREIEEAIEKLKGYKP